MTRNVGAMLGIALGRLDGWQADFATLPERANTVSAKLGTVELEAVDNAGCATNFCALGY
jgi:hypothetical protein